MRCERCGEENSSGETCTLFAGGKIASYATDVSGAGATLHTLYGNFREFSVFYCTGCMMARRKLFLWISGIILLGGVLSAGAWAWALASGFISAGKPWEFRDTILLVVTCPFLGFAPWCGVMFRGLRKDPRRVLQGVCERKIRRAFGFGQYEFYTPENFRKLQLSRHQPK